MNNKAFFRRLGALAGLTAAGVLLLANPDAVAEGCAAGLGRCARTVIPALFPFLVLSECVVGLHIFEKGRQSGAALLMNLVGGFAPGAACLGGLVRTGRVSARRAGAAACFFCAGPSFVITVAGYGVLGSVSAGLVLWASLVAASLCCMALARVLWPDTKPAAAQISPAAARTQTAAPASPVRPVTEPFSLAGAVNSATGAMLQICGFVVLFAVADRLFFPAGGAGGALLEVTAGCSAAAKTHSLLLLVFSLSLLGLCGVLQIRALLPRQVSLLPFLLTRPLHFALSFGFVNLLFRLVPGCRPAALTGRVILTCRLPWQSALCLFLFLAVGCSVLSPASLRKSTNEL